MSKGEIYNDYINHLKIIEILDTDNVTQMS